MNARDEYICNHFPDSDMLSLLHLKDEVAESCDKLLAFSRPVCPYIPRHEHKVTFESGHLRHQLPETCWRFVFQDFGSSGAYLGFRRVPSR